MQRKQLFFEKKNQKTFTHWVTRPVRSVRIEVSKSFLVLFLKKNCFFFYLSGPRVMADFWPTTAGKLQQSLPAMFATLRLVFALLILAAPACARSADGTSQEGTWIWDPDLFIPWPNMQQDPRLVAETMSVTRDDGRRFIGSWDLRYSDGERDVFTVDQGENGAAHPVATSFGQMTLRVTVQPDGGRRMVSSSPGTLHDAVCYLQDAGMTLACDGTHRSPDGSVGYFRCVYHRDPHVTPVS